MAIKGLIFGSITLHDLFPHFLLRVLTDHMRSFFELMRSNLIGTETMDKFDESFMNGVYTISRLDMIVQNEG